ncbi:hypothetical protein [Paenibacillus sp. 32O-W]|uniref:hypothetical protein n=1 Tax=Paenibacillus sp. 32O-W TaxID=1695218 RepID=UPI00119CBDDA|nr:hypothetical protein [Paenibacillus sp. 32O-W]
MDHKEIIRIIEAYVEAEAEKWLKSSLAPSKGIPTSFVFDLDNEGNAVVKELLTRDKNQMIMNDQGEVADATGEPLKVVAGKFR